MVGYNIAVSSPSQHYVGLLAMPASTSQQLRESRFAPPSPSSPLPDGQNAKSACPRIQVFLEVDPFEVSGSATVTVKGSSLITKRSCCSSVSIGEYLLVHDLNKT